MAVTDVKHRRHPFGLRFTLKVDDGVVYWKDDQNNTTFRAAFSLPPGAKQAVAFEIWQDGILEIVYIDSDGNPQSKKSSDLGENWR
jgi:hypothetical protein